MIYLFIPVALSYLFCPGRGRTGKVEALRYASLTTNPSMKSRNLCSISGDAVCQHPLTAPKPSVCYVA